MIYQLIYRPAHPAYEIHNALNWFVNNLNEFANVNELSFHNDYPWMDDILSNHDRLLELLVKLFNNYQALESIEDKLNVINTFNYWNDVDNRCQNFGEDFLVWEELPLDIKSTFSILYIYLYNQLTRTSTTLNSQDRSRSNHYRDFYHDNGEVCCFCGIKELDEPEVQNGAYDHYLHITKYPFAAINYRNIVPMCDKCNEPPGKGDKHAVFENYASRIRRKANYPYEEGVSKIVKLKMDTIFPGVNNVQFSYSGDNLLKINVWLNLFDIESKYQGALRTKRKSWIDRLIIKNRNQILNTEEELRDNIQEVIQDILDCGKYTYRHLELAFWEYVLTINNELELLRTHVNEERLIRWSQVN
jgi:hypothetical protein